MEIRLETNWTDIKIYIDDLLHVSLKKEGLFAVQAWQEGYGKDATYHIEYSHKDGSIISEYWDVECWKKVIKALDEQDLFSL